MFLQVLYVIFVVLNIVSFFIKFPNKFWIECTLCFMSFLIAGVLSYKGDLWAILYAILGIDWLFAAYVTFKRVKEIYNLLK